MEDENKHNPSQINLRRHVYHPMLTNSYEEDFLDLEKARQGSVYSIVRLNRWTFYAKQQPGRDRLRFLAT